jgi:hypothetical protein
MTDDSNAEFRAHELDETRFRIPTHANIPSRWETLWNRLDILVGALFALVLAVGYFAWLFGLFWF